MASPDTPSSTPAQSSEATGLADLQAMMRKEFDALKAHFDARFQEISAMVERLERIASEVDTDQRVAYLQRRHALELVLCEVRIARRQSDTPAAGVPGFPEQIAAIEGSPLFNADWYLETYADAREAGVNPRDHYVRAGAFEGRNPGPEFDTIAYYLANPDVAAAGWPALVHYVMYGATEGRARS